MFFYINPMSYGNLELYDKNLINNIINENIYFFGNIKMSNPPKNSFLIYKYNNYNNNFFGKFFSYFYSQLILLSKIKYYKPPIVHFQWLKVPFLDYLIIKKIKKYETKVVYTAHNKLPHNSGNKYRKIYKKIYNTVDYIIVHTEKTKEELMDEFNLSSEKIEVIPHGIMYESRKYKKVKAIEKRLLDSKKIKISFLGSISKYKGIDFLVDAWIKFENKYPNNNLTLIIAGKGKIPKKSDLLKSNNVYIDNRFLDNKEFYTYLKLSDIILLPYKEISQSGVLFDALAERKLVIVTDKGGLGEPYKKFGLGWLVKDNNIINELFKIFEEINNNPLVIEEKNISESEWQKLEEFYSWKNIGKKTKELYDKLLKANG